MIGISLTVIVCALTLETAAAGQETVRSCEVFNEARPMTDLWPCHFRRLRDGLGRAALERAGRQLRGEESAETTCRMMTGGGTPTG